MVLASQATCKAKDSVAQLVEKDTFNVEVVVSITTGVNYLSGGAMDKSAEERILEDLIRHMYTHRHLSNLGYDSMSMQMQNVYNSLVCTPVGDRNA